MAEPVPAQAPPARSRRPVRALLARFLAVSVGAGFLTAVLASPVVVSAGIASNATVHAFNSLPSAFEQQPLSQQSKILYSDGSPMATFYYENRIEVPLDQVAPVMQQAIVAIEDSRFWEHGGVDPRGIARALVNNATGKDVQGASTLTQQWIKNVQVEKAVSALPSNATIAERQKAFAGATESSGIAGYTRKLREIKLAIAADKRFSKKQILDNYLNITSFGDGQYGVEAASQHYFNMHAKDLPLPDAALLAGMVQNPIYLDPVSHPDAALERRDIVLDKMLQQKLIDTKAHDDAKALTIAQQLSVQPINNGCSQAGASAYFCEYAYRSLLADPRLGQDVDARRQRLFRGGLNITTTLDRNKQAAADASVKDVVPADTKTAAAAAVTVEPGSGKVVAMAQNRNYTTSSAGPAGSTAVNYSVDEQYGGSAGFQTGSSYKVFTLANWLATGHTLNQIINAPTDPTYDIAKDFRSCERLSGPYKPKNSEGDEAGPMSVYSATANSVNTAFMEMARQLDLCQIRSTAEALGVHRADGKPLNGYPSSILGTNQLSPLTMAAAYAAFADNGVFCTPYPVQSVTDASGTSLLKAAPDCQQKISPDVANGVTSALVGVLTRGTAAGRGINWPAAGKTGTTNFTTAQTWFVGYTKQLSTAVWVGSPDILNIPFTKIPIKGRAQRAFGATYAAPIWQEYMNQAMAGLPQIQFTPPPGNIVGAPAATPPPPGGTTTSRPTARPTSRPTTRGTTPAPAPAPSTQNPAPPATQPADGNPGDQGAPPAGAPTSQ